MRKILALVFSVCAAVSVTAQGWPSQWKGVMLQGFYWDSYADTQWSNLESQADELAEFFNLVWIPQSGKSASEPSMGYNDLYWFTDYTSSFGNEQQLRSMINTFKAKGIGTIADVVINHRQSLDGTWMSFPEETYNGVTYTMLPSDICSDDDGGATAAGAEVAPTGAKDSGDDFNGSRDLDHSSANVQTIVKAYLGFLLNDLGYAGFRYDMVKGYSPSYTGIYNTAAKPEYSVGEYWDGNTQIKNWIDGTAVDGVIQSAAFDFPLKYNLNNCCNRSSNWNSLAGSSLMSDTKYRRYAITFVDNHDTYGRGNNNDLTANAVAANAFILAAPGSPCVFLPHWKEHKQDIKQMIYARNLAGIHSESTFTQLVSNVNTYSMKTDGTDGKSVIVIMGNTAWPQSTVAEADYYLINKGNRHAYYISRNVETAWTSVPSGTYDGGISLTLNAITTSGGAQIVYTTDGTEPSATNGTVVADGTEISIDATTTLKAAMLTGGTVSGAITRNYTITQFQPYDITVYVNTDAVGWSSVNFWSWGGDGSHSPTNTNWPGDNVSVTTDVDGKAWYAKTYRINTIDDYVSFVFSTGTGSPQTVDINNVKETSFFEISATMSNGKHLADNVTDQHATGISGIVADGTPLAARTDVFTVDGCLVRSFGNTGVSAADALRGLDRGLYIVGGKKYVVR